MKKVSIPLIVCLLLNIFSIQVKAYDKNQIPEYIKIGVRFAESSIPLISMFSKGEIEVGTIKGNTFNSIMSISAQDGIIVRKDGYFLNLNGSFIEYEFNKQRDDGNLLIQGPVHIQIGNLFKTREEAEKFLDSMHGIGYPLYLAFENGWRVWTGLYSSEEQALIDLQKIKDIQPSMNVVIMPANNNRIQVLTASGNPLLMLNTGEEEYYFSPSLQSGETIKVDGKNFRGSIGIKRYIESDLTVINRMGLEEYLYGVVPKEMSGSWPIEAQKAQAVAARNYAIQNMNKHKDLGFNLCATTHCQVYGGYDSEHEKSKRAVEETKGKVLTYDEKLVSAFYHSNSGGHTENSENIWTNSFGYIRGIEDPYSVGAPNDTWSYMMTEEQIEEVLNSKSLSVGDITGIKITEFSNFGRVLKLQIDGTNGSKILEKEKVRSIFGYNNIKSTWFKISSNGGLNILSGLSSSTQNVDLSSCYIVSANGVGAIRDSNSKYVVYNGTDYNTLPKTSSGYLFEGKGWGHGLGMSQWGAKKMAELGFSYEEILTYYYQGTKLE